KSRSNQNPKPRSNQNPKPRSNQTIQSIQSNLFYFHRTSKPNSFTFALLLSLLVLVSLLSSLCVCSLIVCFGLLLFCMGILCFGFVFPFLLLFCMEEGLRFTFFFSTTDGHMRGWNDVMSNRADFVCLFFCFFVLVGGKRKKRAPKKEGFGETSQGFTRQAR